MLTMLFDYYKKYKLSGDIESEEYKVAQYNLRHIIEETRLQLEFSKEIEDVIDEYLQPSETTSESDELEQLDYLNDNSSEAGFDEEAKNEDNTELIGHDAS